MASGVHASVRHHRIEFAQAHAVAVAQSVEGDRRALAIALQVRSADRRPSLQRAGNTEIRIADDLGRHCATVAAAAPAQTARVDAELE